MLKLGLTSPILHKIFQHKSTDSNFYHFTKTYTDLLEKIQEEMVGALSIVFTRKAVVGKILIRKSTNLCNFNMAIDGKQL